MIKNRICWALLILLAIGVFIFTNTYYAFWLPIAVIVIPLISLVFMLLSAKGFSMELELPQIMEKGVDTSFSYVLKNTSLLPIARVAFLVRTDNQMTLSGSEKKAVSSVGGRDSAKVDFVISQARAGATAVSTQKIKIEDAFGIFSIKRDNLHEGITVVYPTMRDVEVFLDKPVETLGEGTRWAQDRHGNDVSEVFAVREYAAGDEVRKIHWKLSSKLEKTMVRDFSLPLNFSVFLLLEMSKADEDVMDRALEIYVSVSRVLLEKGINHNLAWYDGGEECFHICELQDFEDMEIALAQVLSSFAYEEESPALDYYRQSGYCDPRSTLIYVGTNPDVEKLEEVSVRQQIRIIDAGKEEPVEVWV